MGAMTSLSNRECVALLKEWGFEDAGGKGGHAILQYNGRRVQVSAPGRSAATPYKALRKAAKILEIKLKDLLKGPVKPAKAITPEKVSVTEKEETVTVSVPVVEAQEELVCPTCGKTGFKTVRGFKGHQRSHETVVCSVCHEEFSRQGMPMHRATCQPPKRRGRRSHAMPEAPARTGRTRKIHVEVPEILEPLDDDFPSPAPFQEFVESSEVEDDLLDRNVLVPRTFADDSITVLLKAFFPGRTLNDEQVDEFLNWVEATKALLDTL